MRRGENIFVVVPHQDDEMFLYHRIRYLIGRGRNLHIVWVTDGAANNEEIRKSRLIRLFIPILATRSDELIRQVRRRESTALMLALGLPRENLHFLSYPSGQIKDCFSQIVASLADIFEEFKPEEVYTVAYDHSHFEHDACNAAVRLAFTRPGTLYEFPVYNVYKGIPRHHRLVPHAGHKIKRTPFSRAQERERLRFFNRFFKSQWSVAWIERIGSLLPSDYKRFGEPYREMVHHDYSKQVPGASVGYIPKSLQFEDFSRMVSDYLNRSAHITDS